MSSTPYDVLVSPENFRLAWDRVRYFDRPDSRDWIGLKVFAANRDYNLEMLRQSLIERTFEPSTPEIRYLPKASLTLRPMAILPISDRIVFQAMANVIAERGRSTLAMVANRQSFANVLSAPGQKRMFVHWKKQYRLFRDRFCELVEEGNTWLVETDIAAFYETIDHSFLYRILLEAEFLDDRTIEYLQAYLPVWSALEQGERATRGIPQGCLASDLIANVFLYKFDADLAVQEFHYLRYVDDIRLLAKAKDAVQRGLIRIDRSLKSTGVLLQTRKTMVRQITDLAKEIDRMASQLSELDRRLREPLLSEPPPVDPLLQPSLHDVALLGDDISKAQDPARPAVGVEEELLRLFWRSKESIDSDHQEPFAERHLRFCLYRLDFDLEIAEAVLPFFVERPWLSESIAQYLQNGKLNTKTVDFLLDVIVMHNVYDSVVALAIDILIRQGCSMRSQHELFRQWLISDTRDWPLLCAAAVALGDSSDNMSVFLQAMKCTSPSVRRAATIQALRVARDQSEATHVLKRGIRDCSPVAIDALIYQLYNEWGLRLGELGVDEERLTDYCIAYARGYDHSLPTIQPDYIRHILSTRYSVDCPKAASFRALLGSHYGRAADFLWTAENSYLANASRYVSQLDLFHEELLYPIMVDKLQLKTSREELAKVELTNRLDLLQRQKRELGAFVGALLACRRLRANPETHSRLHHQLTVTSPVSWRQRDGLKKTLSGGYQELVDWISEGCP